jgi:DNA polymerase III, subunit gamma and tau
MSYVVFARKWRPLTFEDVVGQEHITETLKKAIEKDRVAHAYIFTGTRGVGKTTTARILARALNCEKGPTPTPCGVCGACKNIISGSSFDVIEIDGASNNSVDDIREIRDNVHYSSMGGKYRIYVIDEVHMLSKSAFNALLKTLEEPPPQVIFIFATTEPQKIPATIQSRCQRYDFRRISTEQIVGRLSRICADEHINADPKALLLVGRKADGSMRDALSLLDQVYSYCQETIGEKDVRSVLGLVDTEVYNTMMDAISAKNPEPVLRVVQDILYRGFDLQEFIVGFEEYLRTLLFSSIPQVFDNPRIELRMDADGATRERAALFSEKTLLRMAEIVRKTENDLKWSVFPRFLVELTLLKLVYLDSTVEVEHLLETFKEKTSQPSQSSAPLFSAEPAPALIKKKIDVTPPVMQDVREGPVSPASDASSEAADTCTTGETKQNAGVLEQWPRFLEALQRERPMLGHYLKVAQVASLSESAIDVRFPRTCNAQYAELIKNKNREEINRILKEIMGASVDLHITLEAGGPVVVQAEKNSLSINDEIEHEPIIKNVLDIFDGELID